MIKNNIKSRYLTVEMGENYGAEIRGEVQALYDLYGTKVQDVFINDIDHEKVIGVCHAEKQDYILVLEKKKRPLVVKHL